LIVKGPFDMAKKIMPVEKLKASTTPQKTIAKAAKSEEAEERRYKAKYALEDIERAEMHRKDKDLMREVKSLAKEKVKCLTKIK